MSQPMDQLAHFPSRLSAESRDWIRDGRRVDRDRDGKRRSPRQTSQGNIGKRPICISSITETRVEDGSSSYIYLAVKIGSVLIPSLLLLHILFDYFCFNIYINPTPPTCIVSPLKTTLPFFETLILFFDFESCLHIAKSPRTRPRQR